jgi:hypothetical protein
MAPRITALVATLALSTSAVAQAPAASPPDAAPAKPARSAVAKGPAKAGAKSPAGPRAMDRLDLDTTQITGNRELPKVMVVVPWKRSDLGDLVGKPINSLVDEALQPVDREVFRREVEYYGALAPDRPASGPGTDAPAGPHAGSTNPDAATAAGSPK